jgi:hypothetical protein
MEPPGRKSPVEELVEFKHIWPMVRLYVFLVMIQHLVMEQILLLQIPL